jgi:hypothetical protein
MEETVELAGDGCMPYIGQQALIFHVAAFGSKRGIDPPPNPVVAEREVHNRWRGECHSSMPRWSLALDSAPQGTLCRKKEAGKLTPLESPSDHSRYLVPPERGIVLLSRSAPDCQAYQDRNTTPQQLQPPPYLALAPGSVEGRHRISTHAHCFPRVVESYRYPRRDA